MLSKYDFVKKLLHIANDLPTSYMLGAFGHFANTSNISYEVARKDVNNKPYEDGALKIKGKGWMFDCVGLAKGIIWGFNDLPDKYGGAVYQSNGLKDQGADTMINNCLEVSTDFTNIDIGEAVWLKGHIGFYVGNNQVVECTPRWSVYPGVKITVLGNRESKGGMVRSWTKHGKLPWIDYTEKQEVQENQSERPEIYHSLEEVPEWGKEAISYFVNEKVLEGVADKDLGLSLEMIRILTVLYRILKKEG